MSRAQRGPGRRGSRGRLVRLVALTALIAPFTAGCSVEDVIRFGWPVGVTPQAEALGITAGMTGREAVERMLRAMTAAEPPACDQLR